MDALSSGAADVVAGGVGALALEIPLVSIKNPLARASETSDDGRMDGSGSAAKLLADAEPDKYGWPIAAEEKLSVAVGTGALLSG